MRGARFPFLFLFSVFLTLSGKMAFSTGHSGLSQRLGAVIDSSQQALLRKRASSGAWHYKPNLGSHFTSLNFISSTWFDGPFTWNQNARSALKTHLLNSQLKNGAWCDLRYVNRSCSHLDATLLNYWALKILGMSPMHPQMLHARKFILSRGGAEKASLLVKHWLALFAQLPWSKTPIVPYALAFEKNVYQKLLGIRFASWAVEHIRALTYLRANKVIKFPEAQESVAELFRQPKGIPFLNQKKSPFRNLTKERKALDVIYNTQGKYGTWGGYLPATVLSLIALKNAAESGEHSNLLSDQTKLKQMRRVARKRMFSWVYSGGYYHFEGLVMDGHYWDSMLVAQALVVSGLNSSEIKPTVDYLVKNARSPQGGFVYGEDFSNLPDLDDTSEMLILLKESGLDRDYPDVVNKAIAWVLSMQNKDHSWGAFYKDNDPPLLAKLLTKPFTSIGDLFDEGSFDITGHVLEALGHYGFTVDNHQGVAKAAKSLLRGVQKNRPMWKARWGVNYIYGTHAAVTGLRQVGVPANKHEIHRALYELAQRQNTDGGFGESVESYQSKKWMAKGPSTVSQTAWALMALIRGGFANTVNAHRAVDFLLRSYESRGFWFDDSIVGTGHPKVIYMDYPSYADAWPLMALGMWKKATHN